MDSLAADVIRGCWITFVVAWAFAAASTKRSVYREDRIQRLGYTLIFAAGCFFIFRGRYLGNPLNLRLVPETDAIAMTSIILCVAGLVFCIWARATLGRNWSGIVTLKEEHELIVRGPYRFVRHPIYTGLVAMFIATFLVRGHVAGIIGVALVFLSFWIKLSYEEELMLKQFPDRYAYYRQHVKRIIPFVL